MFILFISSTLSALTSDSQTYVSYDLSKGDKTFHTVVSGTISEAKLTIVSFARANYRFIHRTGAIYYNTGVDAKMSGTTLNVSKL